PLMLLRGRLACQHPDLASIRGAGLENIEQQAGLGNLTGRDGGHHHRADCRKMYRSLVHKGTHHLDGITVTAGSKKLLGNGGQLLEADLGTHFGRILATCCCYPDSACTTPMAQNENIDRKSVVKAKR